MEHLAKTLVLDCLHSLAQDIKLLPRDLSGDQEWGDEKCGLTLNTLYRGIGWMLWSSVQYVFVEYPKVLQ